MFNLLHGERRDACRLGGDRANRFRPPRADDHSATSNRSSKAPPIGEKLEMPCRTRGSFGAKLLKSLALPRGLEPLFSPWEGDAQRFDDAGGNWGDLTIDSRSRATQM